MLVTTMKSEHDSNARILNVPGAEGMRGSETAVRFDYGKCECDVCGTPTEELSWLEIEGEGIAVCDECAPAFTASSNNHFRRNLSILGVCVLVLPVLHFAYTSADRSVDVRVVASGVGSGEILTSEMLNEGHRAINEEIAELLSGRSR